MVFVDETHVFDRQIYTHYTRDRLKFSFLKATFSLHTITVYAVQLFLQYISFNTQKIKGYIRYRLDATSMFPVRFLKRMALNTTQGFLQGS